MPNANTLGRELKVTSRLGIPLALGEMGWMSTYIVDALMIGRMPHSALPIAASSLGNTIFYAIAFCAIGLLTGLQTLTAQAFGRGDERDCARSVAQAMWFVVALTPIVIGATLLSVPLLAKVKTPADIVGETSRYLNALVWSTLPLLLYWTLRRYLQSINKVLLIMVSLLTGSLVNFLGDWALIPRFGIAGSAWATCIVRVLALSLLLIEVLRDRTRRRLLLSPALYAIDWPRMRSLFRIGWPAAIESLADLGVSTFMSILCAQLGTTLLAAHQVVLDLDAFVYMVPLGLSYATSVRVGQSVGQNSIPGARRSVKASLILGLGFITAAASIFVGFSHFWAGIYSNDHAVAAAAVPIFLFCGLLQFGDAAGIILAAALVGIGDTRTPLIINLIWSWVLGMPLSYWLTFHEGFQLKGLWTGRVLAAVGSSTTLALLFGRRLSAARRERVSVIMPFYRAGKYIDEAIESIFQQQGYTDWRLYLINDGSDDGDRTVAERWRKMHPEKITLLDQPHSGISAARNLGLQQSKGDVVAFLDADDTWYPHKLRSQIETLDAHPEADMIYGPALRWDSWNGGIDAHVPAEVDGFGSDCLVPGPALLATYLRDEALTPCTGSVLIRRSALERVGAFHVDFPGVYDDQVLYAKLCASSQVYVSSDCVSRYRKHPESCCALCESAGNGLQERDRFLHWLQTECELQPALEHLSPALHQRRRTCRRQPTSEIALTDRSSICSSSAQP